MKCSLNRREEGMALLLAVFFAFIAVVTLTTITARVVGESRQIDEYTSYENCMYGIESAYAESLASLENGGTGLIGVTAGATCIDDSGNFAADFSTSGVTPEVLTGMPSVDYFAYARNWGNDGFDNNGDGTIDGPEEQWWFTIYPASRDNGTTRAVEVVTKAQDVNVWRNAIFAGAGQAGGVVNGNVNIAGSVHLLGVNVLPGNEAITALDLSGTSLIRNNYGGMPADLSSRIPAPPARTLNGESVSTLNAVLRVRNGLVGISGNSEIGQPNVTGNPLKETVDSTYVNDGWTGNKTIDDGGRGDPQSVYSDNGWDETYDLGERVGMPMLEDDWRDPVTGAKVWDPVRGDWYTHREYFTEVLVADPVNRTDGIYTGSITIRCNQNFYYNASRPTDADPTHRLATDDFIYYNSATKLMHINGQIAINGDLSFVRGTGSDDTVHYTGRGAILASGNVSIDTNLYTVNADGSIANSFPQANAIGIMAGGNMVVGSTAQLTLMGAFYAQGTVSTCKQSNIAGTFVGSYFDMGTNVPSIFQVPTLADHLPYGIIGAYPILAFTRVSWREIGL